MTKKLFSKLLSDLKGYRGSFALHLMNEPTLDDRIPEFIKEIRKDFKDNRIYVSTNGTLVNEEYLKNLFKIGLTELSISCYTKGIFDKYKHLASDKIKVHNFIEMPDSFYNRGGNIDVSDKEVSGYCERPFETMYIKWNGECVLCCSDYNNEAIMGDASKDSLREIFNNKKYNMYRQHLSQGKRDLPLCDKCDYAN